MEADAPAIAHLHVGGGDAVGGQIQVGRPTAGVLHPPLRAHAIDHDAGESALLPVEAATRPAADHVAIAAQQAASKQLDAGRGRSAGRAEGEARGDRRVHHGRGHGEARAQARL